MTSNELMILWKNFYYTYTYATWAILAGLVLFIYLSPKAALKTFAVIAVSVLIIYFFSILGKSSSTGMDSKKQMINQTVDRDR